MSKKVKKVELEQGIPQLIHFDRDKVKKNYSVIIYDQRFNQISNELIELYERDYIIIRSFSTKTIYINFE